MLPWFARLVSFQTSRRGQPHGRNGCGCSRRCNFAVRPPSFSRLQSDLRRKAALATKRTRTVRRSRRDPGPALSFRLAASCRRASKNSFIHFLGAGAPSPEWSGCGLFLGQAPPSPRPSQHHGLPYLRRPAQSRLLIRSCRERSCRPLGALVGLYRPMPSSTRPPGPAAVHHSSPLQPASFGTRAFQRSWSSLYSPVRSTEGSSTQPRLNLNSCRRIASHVMSSHVMSAHVGSFHCPNIDKHASFTASASNRAQCLIPSVPGRNRTLHYTSGPDLSVAWT